jgi:putative FmdB family regulatory protein
VPTYQYTCTDCGEPIEAVQKFTDEPLSVCAACGGKLRKVFSPVGIVFKGSGFYRTDNRNGSGSRSEATNGKQPSESTSAAKPSEPGSGGNGSAAKSGAAKSGETTPASSKSSSSSSGEKVA